MKLLLVQFYSDLLTKDESPKAKQYYDRLYSGARPGFHRFGPTWEIPQWMAEMKRNFPEARTTWARDIADVQAKQDGYTHIAFSALDCNWHLIRTIAQAYTGTVIVGGYCDIDNLQDLKNVVWCHSIQECCEIFNVPYRQGVDYDDFDGAKTIGRLTLSTGCRHRCRFCTVPDDVVKTRPSVVYQQADELCRLRSPLVYVNDKTFGQAKNFWLLPQLFRYFTRNMITIFDGFIIQTTASQLLKLDDDFFAASGIRYVELGIETYNDSILADLHKPATEKTIDAATEKLRRIGIRLIPNIMIGLPGETGYTYSRTLEWLYANADVISHVNAYNLVVYADSQLADEIEAADKDSSENEVGKSWHTDILLHETFADRLYDFGLECLGSGPITSYAEAIQEVNKANAEAKDAAEVAAHIAEALID